MIAAALRTLAASLRYNSDQARADLSRMKVRTVDEYYHQGYQSGRIAAMEDVVTTLDMLDSAGLVVVVPLEDWARAPELLEHARRRGIPVAEAVRELVNSGLSHR